MPIFIDESGNTGSIDGGGSRFFHMAAVWVPTLAHADRIRQDVRELRRTLNLRSNYEFKFSNTQHPGDRCAAFFNCVLAHPFRFVVSNVDKRHPDWIKADSRSLYHISATELASTLRSELVEAERRTAARLRDFVTVDDNRDPALLGAVKQKFQALGSELYPGSKLVGRVEFRRSHLDEMLQLADMVCGATARYRDAADPSWYRRIRSRDIGRTNPPEMTKGHPGDPG